MPYSRDLPDGLEHVRTTPDFTEATAPAGLRRSHRVADGVWGRIVVRSGTATLVLEDDPDHPVVVRAGEAAAIPPVVPHHVETDGPAVFAVEFHRAPDAAQPAPEPGTESSGLVDD